MVNRCIVKGCRSESKDGFRFPTDRPETFKKWITAIEQHQKLPPNFEMEFVCSAHFTKTDYLKGKRAQINKKAVPSVFPEINDEGDSAKENQHRGIKVEPVENENNGPRRSKRVASLVRPKIKDENRIDFDPSDEDNESPSEDNVDGDSQDLSSNENMNPITDVDLSRCDSIFTFMEIDLDEPIDSDYEPVTETSIEKLQNKLTRKTEALQNKQKLLESMEEIANNQAATILRLKDELAELMKVEAEEIKSEKTTAPEKSGNKSVTNPAPAKELNDYRNIDLQMFAISLFYFSPKVYYYLASIMPYLPPKNTVIDWVKSGYAFTLFPPGIIRRENFTLDK